MDKLRGDTLVKFMAVDDDDVMLGLYTDILEPAGHQVITRNSSIEAISEISSIAPDVLLVDIMMPGLDGLEFCKRVREMEQFAALPIIVISSKSYEFDRKRAQKMGANGFIMKPIDVVTFTDEIAQIIQDRMELTFWGVRGTLPVPGEGSLRHGGNTSCVTLEFSQGPFFIFDAGTGIKVLSDHLRETGRSRVEAKLFISHPHWDHINALPFFEPMYTQGSEFEILGASHGDVTMRELISAQMDDVYFPITLKEFAARVYFRDLHEETIEIGKVTIRTKLLSHPGYCLGYRVEYNGRSICYVTDNELFLESDPSHNAAYVETLAEFVSETDVLITDCTYTDEEYKSKVGWGHSCISQVVDLADRGNVKTLALFHHDPDQDDAAIDAKWEEACRLLKSRGSSTECVAPVEREKITI